jgi:hypothetical protein
MAEHPEKKAKQPKAKIQIQTRKPEKRGIFANIGSDRAKEIHPLRDILNFPAGSSENSVLASQTSENLDSQSGNDLDSQIKQSLDNQTKQIGYPNRETADIQTDVSGYPNADFLDSKIAKNENRIAKKTPNLDSKIAKSKNLDSQNESELSGWAKYDRKRKSKGVFLRTSDDITKRFKQFCIENEWDFSYGTELAWNKLMTDLDSQKNAPLDSLIALDDRRLKMMYKSKPVIINLYLRYNAVFNELAGDQSKGKWTARWTPRDDEAAAKFNDLKPAIIELGILQTQTNKGFGQGKIQTFKYYAEEIEKVLLSGVSDEMLETILQYHRQIWRNLTKREVDLGFLEEIG